MKNCRNHRKFAALTASIILSAATFAASFANISVFGAETDIVSQDPADNISEESIDMSSTEDASATGASMDISDDIAQAKDQDAAEDESTDISEDTSTVKDQDAAEADSEQASKDAAAEEPEASSEESSEADDASTDSAAAAADETDSNSETGKSVDQVQTGDEEEESAEADESYAVPEYSTDSVPAQNSVQDSIQDSVQDDSDVIPDPEAAANAAATTPAEEQAYLPITSTSAEGGLSPAEEYGLDTANDDVFAAYVNRELDLSGDLRFDTGGFDQDSNRMEKAYVSSRLNSVNLKVYNKLYSQICNVAAGKRSDTVFSFSASDIGISGRRWSASELGISQIISNNSITGQAMAALDKKSGLDLNSVVMSLIADCPYELYWFDKEAGAEWGPIEYTAEWINGEWKLSYTANSSIPIRFYVSADYSASGGLNTLRVNQGIGTAVKKAHDTALSIVSSYSGSTDYEKLMGYKDAICDLASYNTVVGSNMNAYAYGDPWQLIWVFDQDERTQVVCEGYAKSFQYLCDLTSWHNIFRECICVTGKMSSGTGSGDHMWNIVSLGNGNSYLADLTNCDDGTVGQGNGRTDLFLAGTGSPSSGRVCAQGSLSKGYTFSAPVNSTYTYDQDTRHNFDNQILTLAAGRPDKNTTVDFSKAVISGIKNKTYNGKAQTQAPVVVLGSLTLRPGKDYKISYSGNTNAGTATVIIQGLGIYSGTHKRTFTISKAAQSFTVKSASTVEYGKTTRVTASGAKGNAKYSFTSSNTGIAAVSSNGTVTGKKPGTVTITVRTAATTNYNAASRTVKITVYKVLKKPGYCHFVRWNNKNYTGCRIAWNKTVGAEGYQTFLCWTNGSHASYTTVGPNVLYRDCKVYANHISLMQVRAFYTLNGVRKYGPWSNIEFITPSPTKLTCKNVSTSSKNLKMKVSWPIIYGCNGYNVFITTNPNGQWYWNQSTAVRANATSAVITKCNGKLKKKTRYYVRIVSRRKYRGVFCSVPMPAKNTFVGSFVIK